MLSTNLGKWRGIKEISLHNGETTSRGAENSATGNKDSSFFFISIYPLQKTNTEHEKGHLTDKIFKTSLISVS